ncbi:hypothetical protein IB276_33155 [Ensifer sp. ENS04]|uniref:hypothetical protein n=1 Tax=Ensifer sp. ENS04 TaxID=2769281 RepID=UPI0017853169|nr:hypothetical protein [Ensifer sp. ENS04]MBD9544296.1 hypothetical protein [Ensifer sp. ENS04]
MTVYLTLNRPAVASLIEQDPDFAFELKIAVVSEVVRKFIERDARRIIKDADPELFAKALEAFRQDADIFTIITQTLTAQLTTKPADYWSKARLSDETKKLVEEQVALLKERTIREAAGEIAKPYREAIEKAVADKLAPANLDELVEKRVAFITNQHIDKLVNERVNQRLADLKALLGNG